MAPETRNLIAAMSLSLAILIGWQLYVVEPDLQADRAAYEAQQQSQQNQTGTKGQIAQTGVGAGQTSTDMICLLYTSPSPRDRQKSRMPSSA